MANVTKAIAADLGSVYAGRTDIGYAVKQSDGTVIVALTTAGVQESTAGEFRAAVSVDRSLGELWVEWYAGADRIPGVLDLIDTTPAATSAAIAALAVQNAGSGARTVTITVNDGSTALENASVRLTAGATSYVIKTNASGQAVFNVNDATYTVAIALTGFTFSGASLPIAADTSHTYSMTPITITPPADPTQSSGYCVTYDPHGAPQTGVELAFYLVEPFTVEDADSDGTAWTRKKFTATSDGSALLQTAFKRLATYRGRRGQGDWVQFDVPDEDSFALPALLSATPS